MRSPTPTTCEMCDAVLEDWWTLDDPESGEIGLCFLCRELHPLAEVGRRLRSDSHARKVFIGALIN